MIYSSEEIARRLISPGSWSVVVLQGVPARLRFRSMCGQPSFNRRQGVHARHQGSVPAVVSYDQIVREQQPVVVCTRSQAAIVRSSYVKKHELVKG